MIKYVIEKDGMFLTENIDLMIFSSDLEDARIWTDRTLAECFARNNSATCHPVNVRPVPVKDFPINQAGLLRCCIADITNNEVRTKEGTIHKCQYCKTYIKLVNGAWTWIQHTRPDFAKKE